VAAYVTFLKLEQSLCVSEEQFYLGRLQLEEYLVFVRIIIQVGDHCDLFGHFLYRKNETETGAIKLSQARQKSMVRSNIHSCSR